MRRHKFSYNLFSLSFLGSTYLLIFLVLGLKLSEDPSDDQGIDLNLQRKAQRDPNGDYIHKNIQINHEHDHRKQVHKAHQHTAEKLSNAQDQCVFHGLQG